MIVRNSPYLMGFLWLWQASLVQISHYSCFIARTYSIKSFDVRAKMIKNQSYFSLNLKLQNKAEYKVIKIKLRLLKLHEIGYKFN